ncbi:MAG: hypothetical protein ACPGXL_02075, partial [Chitinophagales bacterium]
IIQKAHTAAYKFNHSKSTMSSLREMLLQPRTKAYINYLVAHVLEKDARFDELVSLMIAEKEEAKLPFIASWVMRECFLKQTKLITPHLDTIVAYLRVPNLHNGIKRNIIGIFQELNPATFSEDLLGEITDICFDCLIDKNEAIAVKAFSMTTLANICVLVPELAGELKLVVEEQMPHGSSGFKSRGKKVIKQMEKLVKNQSNFQH